MALRRKKKEMNYHETDKNIMISIEKARSKLHREMAKLTNITAKTIRDYANMTRKARSESRQKFSELDRIRENTIKNIPKQK